KNRQDLSDKIKKLVEDDVKVELDAEKEKEKVSKDFKNSYNSFNKQQESSFKQFYKTKLDLATGDSAAQKEILLDQRAQIEEGLVLGATSWDNYTKDVGENVKKTAELAKQIAKEAMDSLLKIGNGIMTALGPSVDMLIDKGATIGEVLSKAFQDLIKTLTKVIITAAIAVLLISILFPSMLQTAGGALKLFGGLVGQGMGIGGLIGGGSNTGGSKGVDASSGTNTINAAQANSTSNNNGQFVLRGSDLVLALNRSETSLNLRRGS
ncbi:MAG: hypothetical protein EBT39_06840, partial [Sphingobacteriia bacterium]|nr:hypothetical protein [Candidatus Fonsibacter lacus]